MSKRKLKLLDHVLDNVILREDPGYMRVLLSPVYELRSATGVYVGNIRFQSYSEGSQERCHRYVAQPVANPCFAREHASLEEAVRWLFVRVGIDLTTVGNLVAVQKGLPACL